MLWQHLSEVHDLSDKATARDGFKDALKMSGVSFPEGSAVIVEPSSGVLIVKNTPANHEKVKALFVSAGVDGAPQEDR